MFPKDPKRFIWQLIEQTEAVMLLTDGWLVVKTVCLFVNLVLLNMLILR